MMPARGKLGHRFLNNMARTKAKSKVITKNRRKFTGEKTPDKTIKNKTSPRPNLF
jgi:hypothetical protein